MYKLLSSLGILLFLMLACNQQNNYSATHSIEKGKPNVLIILTDQWRAQATGYAGDPNINTPHLDSLAAISVNFKNAVSGMPVCSPFRASLMTGQRPLTHGVFMNDVQLDTSAITLGKIFKNAGYETGFIGKWHLDGHGRLSYIPPGNRRQGFDFWKANECTHNYNHSVYYQNQDSKPKIWDGYDAVSQTDAAIDFIKNNKTKNSSFSLVLSYGTPHAPYQTAPDKYQKRINMDSIQLRKNVPEDMKAQVRKDLAGYYAHIVALDDMIGKLISSLKKSGQIQNTIVVFTSDHGDLLGSQGAYKKQQPYDESIRVPMLFYIPEQLKISPGEKKAAMNSEDILPTLLGLCKIKIPKTVEGINYSTYLEGNEEFNRAALITCVQPFGQWNRVAHNGREYRGLRTEKYTYTRDLNGPWLLFDNEKDPYQLNNLVGNVQMSELQNTLENQLSRRLKENNDEFLPGMEYIKKWAYPTDSTGTVPYSE